MQWQPVMTRITEDGEEQQFWTKSDATVPVLYGTQEEGAAQDKVNKEIHEGSA